MVIMHMVLYLTMQMDISISETCSLAVELLTLFSPHELVYSIVKLNVYEDSLYYHATSEIYFHN